MQNFKVQVSGEYRCDVTAQDHDAALTLARARFPYAPIITVEAAGRAALVTRDRLGVSTAERERVAAYNDRLRRQRAKAAHRRWRSR